MEVINWFAKIDTMVVKGKQPIEIAIKLVQMKLGLPCTGSQDASKTYVEVYEVPRKGTMH